MFNGLAYPVLLRQFLAISPGQCTMSSAYDLSFEPDSRFLKFRSDYTTEEHLISVYEIAKEAVHGQATLIEALKRPAPDTTQEYISLQRRIADLQSAEANRSEELVRIAGETRETRWAIEEGFAAISQAQTQMVNSMAAGLSRVVEAQRGSTLALESGFRATIAELHWGLARIAHELELNRSVYLEIRDALVYPAQTAGREYRDRAEKNIKDELWEEAVCNLEEALRCYREDFLAHYHLGHLLWFQFGQWEPALDQFRLAARYSDTKTATSSQLRYAVLAHLNVSLLFRLDADKYPERLAVSNAQAYSSSLRAICLASNNMPARVEHVVNCYRTNNLEEARRLIREDARQDKGRLIAYISNPDIRRLPSAILEIETACREVESIEEEQQRVRREAEEERARAAEEATKQKRLREDLLRRMLARLSDYLASRQAEDARRIWQWKQSRLQSLPTLLQGSVNLTPRMCAGKPCLSVSVETGSVIVGSFPQGFSIWTLNDLTCKWTGGNINETINRKIFNSGRGMISALRDSRRYYNYRQKLHGIPDLELQFGSGPYVPIFYGPDHFLAVTNFNLGYSNYNGVANYVEVQLRKISDGELVSVLYFSEGNSCTHFDLVGQLLIVVGMSSSHSSVVLDPQARTNRVLDLVTHLSKATAVSPDGCKFVVTGYRCAVLFDVSNFEHRYRDTRIDGGDHAHFSGTGNSVYIMQSNPSYHTWFLDTDLIQCHTSRLRIEDKPIKWSDTIWSPDCSCAVVLCKSGLILIDIASESILDYLSKDDYANGTAAFSSDGNWLVAVSSNSILRAWTVPGTMG